MAQTKMFNFSFKLSSSFLSLPFYRMVEYSLDLQNINLSAIRTVRVLRPLKAINRVPSKPCFPPHLLNLSCGQYVISQAVCGGVLQVEFQCKLSAG